MPRRRPEVVRAGLLLAGLLLGGVVLLAGCATVPVAQTAPVETTSPAAPAPPATPGAVESEPQQDEPPAIGEQANSLPLTGGTVVRVVDGDTAIFRLSSGREERVRFIGIDTPESTNSIEYFGKEAAEYTRGQLPQGRSVFLQSDVEARDRYGRLLAYVWLEKPESANDEEIRAKMLNARLALDGFAQQMTIQPNSRYAENFRRYVAEARDASRGLWQASEGEGSSLQVAPAKTSGAGGSAFIGNRNTMKFHRTDCSSVDQMNPSNKVALASRQTAISGGYVPCKRCRP